MELAQPSFGFFAKGINQQSAVALTNTALRITPEMMIILDNIVHCEKEGVIKQLFIETCILKLLQLQLEQYLVVSTASKAKVSDKDIERLYLVRQIIEDSPSEAHTLTSLSRHTGLNEFKLKKGFKALFGTTVMSHLHSQRMALAKRLLEETGYTVGEIAERCGYIYAQSFSTAFKKYFGINPDSLRVGK